MDGNRPIGWWVRRLDELLERLVTDAVRGAGLTRRHWQVLHELAGGRTERSTLADGLAPFADTPDLDGILADLTARGWLDRSAPGLALSAGGRAAHERLLADVTRMRRRATDGIPAEDYARTLDTLARMVANLEALVGSG